MEIANGMQGRDFEVLREIKAETALIKAKVDIVDTNVVVTEAKINDIENDISSSIIVDPWLYTTIIQGTFTHRIDSNYYRDELIYNDSQTDGDQLDYQVLMGGGYV